MHLVIFSDLDGSLLNSRDYDYEAARPSVDRIKQLQIPLVLTTSKTRREVELLLADMGLREPFIVESGGGIFFPPGYGNGCIPSSSPSYHMLQLGVAYDVIRRFMKKVVSRIPIEGFGDWSIDEIAERTGLSLDRAALAKQREFTEPFLFDDDSDLQALSDLATKENLKIVKGGRFYHLIGAAQDKGEAVHIAKDVFRQSLQGTICFVGIGDSANDLPMLERVDTPILIPHEDGQYEPIKLLHLLRAPFPGSRGWNCAVEDILNDFEKHR